MPTYEYRCGRCEENFEYFQKITDEPMKTCPVCGGKLTKIISGGVGVIFKGSGFYTTDYKNNSSDIHSKDKKDIKKTSDIKDTHSKIEKSKEKT